MGRALELAALGTGAVSPNPLVGCVIVNKGRRVGEGFHAYFGGPHAEVTALGQAGRRAQGATLYVNLEPCRHWGKTPPCTVALRKAGVHRAVIAMQDPNPLVRGQGIRALRESGIRVTLGPLAQEAQRLNRAFLTAMSRKRPYVTVKVAMSLDGKIATRTGESRWISSPPARRWVHRLRGEVDGILVGSRTVLRDDPELTAQGAVRNPWRIVVDSRLRVSPLAKVCNTAVAPTCVVTTAQASLKRREALLKRGVLVLVGPPPRERRLNDRHVSLRWMVQQLFTLNLQHLLCEGGGGLNAGLLSERLVDEVFLIVAPKLIGGRTAATPMGGAGVNRLAEAIPLASWRWRPLGRDLLIHATLQP